MTRFQQCFIHLPKTVLRYFRIVPGPQKVQLKLSGVITEVITVFDESTESTAVFSFPSLEEIN